MNLVFVSDPGMDDMVALALAEKMIPEANKLLIYKKFYGKGFLIHHGLTPQTILKKLRQNLHSLQQQAL